MKLKRVLLFGSLAVLVLLVTLVALAFNSRVQTWAVRRVLTGQPDLAVEVGNVSVGLQRVVLSQITVRQPGLKLTLPEITADLSVIDAVSSKIRVRRVKAHGWTLDLTLPAPLARGGAPERRAVAGYFAALSGASANANTPAVPATKAEAFAGIFGLLRLPVELSLEEADLAGSVIFPTAAGQPAGKASVTVTGGKWVQRARGVVSRGGQGRDVRAVSQLTATSDIGLRMDAPDSIDRVSAVTDLLAVGTQFPGGARLKAALLAERGAQGVENYRVMVEAEQKALLIFALSSRPERHSWVERWWCRCGTRIWHRLPWGAPCRVFRHGGREVWGDDEVRCVQCTRRARSGGESARSDFAESEARGHAVPRLHLCAGTHPRSASGQRPAGAYLRSNSAGLH